MFSCILVPMCRYPHFHDLAQLTGDQASSYVGLVHRIYNGSVIYYISVSSRLEFKQGGGL